MKLVVLWLLGSKIWIIRPHFEGKYKVHHVDIRSFITNTLMHIIEGQLSYNAVGVFILSFIVYKKLVVVVYPNKIRKTCDIWQNNGYSRVCLFYRIEKCFLGKRRW